VQVIADALKANALSKDGRKLAQYVKSNAFSTVMGKKEFDSKGDLKVSDYVVYRWSKGSDSKYNYAEIE
jgi:branched-chain amino acid transport system substrate-binding protein